MVQLDFPTDIDSSRRIHDHEVYIVFDNDDDGYYFHEWWHKQGKNSFDTFVAKQERIMAGGLSD